MDIFAEKSVVVLGAAGQLGAELCRQLGKASVILPRSSLDITNSPEVSRQLCALNPTAVINAAAWTDVDAAEDAPEKCRAVNATAVAGLARACGELRCPLVHFSTDYVFGAEGTRAVPYTEGDPPAPINVYGQSKWEGEQLAAGHDQLLIIRTCGLYTSPSASGQHRNFVNTILNLASTRPEIRVVNDQRCTPSFVPDVARATLFLLSSGRFGTYHIVNAGSATWYEFAQEIVEHCDKSIEVIPITSEEFAARARRPAYSVLDTAKYKTTGGPPLSHWKDALQGSLGTTGAQEFISSLSLHIVP